MSEIRAFFERTPTITRFLLVSTLIVSSACVFHGDLFTYLTLKWPEVFHSWQVWRVVTSFYYADMRVLPGLMDIYSLYIFSKGIEDRKFGFNAVDYAFYLFIVMPLIVVWSGLIQMSSLLFPLCCALTYTWSRANRFNKVLVYFIEVPAANLPVATLLFTFLLQGNGRFFQALAGMATAYFYQCLESRTLGPVYQFIRDCLGVEQQQNNAAQNRVGTVHTLTQMDGYLRAPQWFRATMEPLLDPKRPAQGKKVGGGASVNTLNGSYGGTRVGGGSSGVKTTSTTPSFRGKGYRLGE